MSRLAEVVGGGRSRAGAVRRERARARALRGRARGSRGFVLEAVYEGYLLHYGESRAFAGMDADMRLLAGDALYALGLARLAESGDLEAVAELSDLISRLGPGAGARAARPTRRRSGRQARRPAR